MKVEFHGIRGCTLKTINRVPALIVRAAPDQDEILLFVSGFEYQNHGRWVHFLTKEEYQTLRRKHPVPPPLSERITVLGLLMIAVLMLTAACWVMIRDHDSSDATWPCFWALVNCAIVQVQYRDYPQDTVYRILHAVIILFFALDSIGMMICMIMGLVSCIAGH